MKLLLDTHIWLWMKLEPSRLGRVASRELQDENNELWLSPISTWEVLLLAAKRKVELRGGAAKWVVDARQNFREAPLTHDIVIVAQELAFGHSDLMDRFLAATAKVLQLTLLTADTRLLGLGDIATMANR